jgi:hypothetical protein
MKPLAANWADFRADVLDNLESPLTELAQRQRAIMLLAEHKLAASGPVVLNEQVAESLYFLLCEQREAISDLLDSYYTTQSQRSCRVPEATR